MLLPGCRHSLYRPPTVLQALRVRYAVSGADIGYAATARRKSRKLLQVCLRFCTKRCCHIWRQCCRSWRQCCYLWMFCCRFVDAIIAFMEAVALHFAPSTHHFVLATVHLWRLSCHSWRQPCRLLWGPRSRLGFPTISLAICRTLLPQTARSMPERRSEIKAIQPLCRTSCGGWQLISHGIACTSEAEIACVPPRAWALSCRRPTWQHRHIKSVSRYY